MLLYMTPSNASPRPRHQFPAIDFIQFQHIGRLMYFDVHCPLSSNLTCLDIFPIVEPVSIFFLPEWVRPQGRVSASNGNIDLQ